ncbi:uncharacterized protein LOC124795783 [Schistocerca piceifrons]|uniref:uncharacterized protein LOC124795783 n=1 Tax=Schistocerca piceifrons TaxID=274613 RepID=UPI001F5F982D|nr:uncharacterized protein LOC124795783 [Schistocerca piceifrons]
MILVVQTFANCQVKINGTRQCPSLAGGDEALDAYRRWQQDNVQAARAFGTAHDEELAIHVRKKTDAKEIWDILTSVYAQSSLNRLCTLLDCFFETSKDDITPTTKYMSLIAIIFHDLCSELNTINSNATLPLSLFHHRIFKTLGPEYQFYRSTWYNVSEPEETTKLLTENFRSIQNSLATQAAGAFYAKSKSNEQHKKQKNFVTEEIRSKKKESHTYLYSKKAGHIITNCPKRMAAGKAKVTANNNNKSSSSLKVSNKLNTFRATSLLFHANSDSLDSWISDLSMTHHISPNKRNFATFQKFLISQWTPALLENFWYVPDVKHQLFSVREATQRGYNVTYDNKDVIIRLHIFTKAVLRTVERPDTTSFCDWRVLDKSHRKPFSHQRHRPRTVSELIKSDVNGPMSVDSINGFRYYVIFKDDYSRFVQIYFMRKECDAIGHKVKVFRSDGGGESNCNVVAALLRDRGTEFCHTCPDTPEQNGVAEQTNRDVLELAGSVLTFSKLPKSFWAYACDTPVFLLCRTRKSCVEGKTPFEFWTGKVFKGFNYLRIFGSKCYVYLPKKFRFKFDDKVITGHFADYANDKDAKFSDYESGYQPHFSQEANALVCLTKAIHEELTPTNFNEAMESSNSNEWFDVMKEEMKAFEENDIWDLVELPKGKRVIDK